MISDQLEFTTSAFEALSSKITLFFFASVLVVKDAVYSHDSVRVGAAILLKPRSNIPN